MNNSKLYKLIKKRKRINQEKINNDNGIKWLKKFSQKVNKITLTIFGINVIMTLPIFLYFTALIPKYLIPLDLLVYSAIIGGIGSVISGSALVIENTYFILGKIAIKAYSNMLKNKSNNITKKINIEKSKQQKEYNIQKKARETKKVDNIILRQKNNNNSQTNKYSYNNSANKKVLVPTNEEVEYAVKVVDGKVIVEKIPKAKIRVKRR